MLADPAEILWRGSPGSDNDFRRIGRSPNAHRNRSDGAQAFKNLRRILDMAGSWRLRQN